MDIVVKYSIPTRLDVAAYGTIYKCLIRDDLVEYWIQVSKDKESSSWVKFGDLLEKVCLDQIEKPLFIDQCLALLENPVSKSDNIVFVSFSASKDS